MAPLPSRDQFASISFEAEVTHNPISANVGSQLLLAFHRLTCSDLPARIVGRFRSTRVKVGRASDYVNESFEPPPAQEVTLLIEKLCYEWNSQYNSISASRPKRKLEAIARYHARLLAVHPFADGNGRVARALLMQQCLDLFGKADMSLMNRGGSYYAALQAADHGDMKPLAELIAPIVQTRGPIATNGG